MGYFPLPELKGKPNRIFVDGKTLRVQRKRLSMQRAQVSE